jgi:hypothetical protein
MDACFLTPTRVGVGVSVDVGVGVGAGAGAGVGVGVTHQIRTVGVYLGWGVHPLSGIANEVFQLLRRQNVPFEHGRECQ